MCDSLIIICCFLVGHRNLLWLRHLHVTRHLSGPLAVVTEYLCSWRIRFYALFLRCYSFCGFLPWRRRIDDHDMRIRSPVPRLVDRSTSSIYRHLQRIVAAWWRRWGRMYPGPRHTDPSADPDLPAAPIPVRRMRFETAV